MNKIVLLVGLLTNGLNNPVYSFEMVSKDNYYAATNYIVSHMNDLNELRNNEGYDSTEISYVRPITINTIEGDIDGQLIKFENGYLLIGSDGQIYENSYEDNLEFPLNASIGFNVLGGFYSLVYLV